MNKRDLVSISDLTKEDIERLLRLAKQLDPLHSSDLCKGNILATCFFEPSTRTRLSFEAAMHRLGGAVIGFSEGLNTSIKKGETLSDSVRVIGSYADILVIRHPQEGAARVAAEITDCPVINGGDGANQHPTQTLIDLYTIQETQGKLDQLSIILAGDLKHGRTIHSLAEALAHYQVRLFLVSPPSLQLPDAIADELRKKGVKFSFHESLEEVLPKADILYMTRLQKERMNPNDSHANYCALKKRHLEKAKPHLRILHPLPRVDEIEASIDDTPHAAYFQQAANGVRVRMAILAHLLGKI